MPDRNGEPTHTHEDANDDYMSTVARRRILQLTGAGIVGGSLAGVAGAAGGSLPHTIVLDGSDSDGRAEYAFGVSGSVEPHGDVGSFNESSDSIDGTEVSGRVYGGVDAYRFSGGLTSLDVDGQVAVSIDYGEAAPDADQLVIVTPNDAEVEYTFTCDGRVEKDLDNGNNRAEYGNDDVTDGGNGTYSVEGVARHGYGDTYDVYGDVTHFEPVEGAFTLLLNGEETTVPELTGQQAPDDGDEGDEGDDGDDEQDDQPTLDEAEFLVGYHHDAWLHYRLHVDSEPTGLTNDDAQHFAASNYDVRQLADDTWLVDGQTGTADPSGPMYGDGYRWSPDEGTGILGWEADPTGDGDYELTLNGDALDPGTLPELDLPEDDRGSAAENGPIGGGQGYGGIVSRNEATTVVRTRGDLSTALSRASTGDVIFVPGDETISMGSTRVTVPAGVTVASNRGESGSSGALIHTNSEPNDLFRLRRNARFTGLRVRGPHPGDDRSGSGLARAVTAVQEGVEIDNNEIWGFSYAGVMTDNGGDAHVHHNVIRECNKAGNGYGVSMLSGNPVIEYNYMDFNRHSVATNGEHYGYVCRYNHFGPKTTSHVIDMHSPAGTRYEVHNNVIEGYVAPNGEQRAAVAVRGVPDDVALMEDNWFFNPDRPRSSPSYNWTAEAIIQPEVGSSWQGVEWRNNHYGGDASVSFSDVIPGYDGWRS